MDFEAQAGGTGARFGRIVIILAGVAALSATLLTFVFVLSNMPAVQWKDC
jgi:hypothetical protein